MIGPVTRQVRFVPGATTSAETVLTTPRSTYGAAGTTTVASSQPVKVTSG